MNKTVLINDILSAQAPILLMPTSSDGKSVGFLSELVNFYRYTYWLNCDYDQLTSFPMVLAERVFGDGEEYLRLLQFKHCEFEYAKDNVIIGKVLDKIASDNADSLLIIDSLECLNDKTFDAQLEYLLKKCPKNLKVVLVGNRFIDLKYNNLDVCPKLITPEQPVDEESFDFSIFSKEDKAFLYQIAALPYVEGVFCEKIYPNARLVLDGVSRYAPGYVMKTGGTRYRLSKTIRQDLPIIECDDEKLFVEYVRFVLKSNHPITAMDLCLRYGYYSLLDEIVDELIRAGKKTFAIIDYFRAHDEFEEKEATSAERKLLIAMIRGARKDAKRMSGLVDEILAETEKGSDLERTAHYVKFLSHLNAGQYRQALDYALDLFRNRMSGPSDVCDWTQIVCRLPEAIKKSEEELDEESFHRYERYLLDEKNAEKYWYPKALQAAAEVYFEWGNYSKATELLAGIKKRIPFYIIPYRLLAFYYYMGDMRLAYDTARQALRDSKFHDIEADLTEVYLLLAKSCDYLNRREEAIKYVDYAVNLSDDYSIGKYNALAYKAIFSAKNGKANYGKDLVSIYEKGFSGRNNRGESMINLAISYCAYCLEEYSEAEKYAVRCEQKSYEKSGAWILSRAIELGVKVKRGEAELSDVEKLFSQCIDYGMTVIVVNYYDCFSPLFDFAKRSGMRPMALLEMQKKVRQKMDSADRQKSVVIRLFGDSYAGVNGKEIRWKTKKEKELFLLYVWKGESGLDRGYLIECLWQDYLYESAVNNLKTTNFMVRKTLTDAGVPFSLRYANGKYYFTLEGNTDLDLFLRYYADYQDTTRPHERLLIARKMYALYNGGFCREVTTTVFAKYREELFGMMFSAYSRVANDLIDSGELIAAMRILQQMEGVTAGEDYFLQIEELKKRIKDNQHEN